jgi:hypothetical protein
MKRQTRRDTFLLCPSCYRSGIISPLIVRGAVITSTRAKTLRCPVCENTWRLIKGELVNITSPESP